MIGAGLGAVHDISDNTRSWLVLQRAVESHHVGRTVSPGLIAPDAGRFILDAGGRGPTPT